MTKKIYELAKGQPLEEALGCVGIATSRQRNLLSGNSFLGGIPLFLTLQCEGLPPVDESLRCTTASGLVSFRRIKHLSCNLMRSRN